jgi:hypothetical protein
MASLVLAGNTSGSITISSPSVSGSNTLTLPANTGTVLTTASTFAGTGPAFSAWSDTQSSAVSSNVNTKVLFQVEEFDTNNNFASSRFTPTVAGYYQINAAFQGAGTVSTARIILYKNGAEYKGGSYLINQGNAAVPVLSTLVYANGTTDYFEVYGNLSGSGLTFYFGQSLTYFNGVMVRSA